MSDILSTLEQAWENAEQGIVKKGDVVIEHLRAEQPRRYTIFVAECGESKAYDDLRIIEHAKPAWADAEYVLARDPFYKDTDRRVVYRRHPNGTFGDLEGGGSYRPDELRDVSILVEQEVA